MEKSVLKEAGIKEFYLDYQVNFPFKWQISSGF